MRVALGARASAAAAANRRPARRARRAIRAAWEAWIAALEAAGDACLDDWRAEHFDPLLGYEPHTQLIEASDAGGRRHFLDGRPVHAGMTLELLLPGGHWLAGRYEWSYVAGELPTLHVELGGTAEAERQGEVPAVPFPLPPARGASMATP